MMTSCFQSFNTVKLFRLLATLVLGLTPTVQSKEITTTTTTIPTTTERQVPLIYRIPLMRLLQTASGIFREELGDVKIPVSATHESQLLAAALQNIDLTRVAKRLLTQNDIRNLLPKPEEVDPRCYSDLIDFVDGLIGQRNNTSSKEYITANWASQMFDAFGKPMPGLLRGTLQWTGLYDECLDVHASVEEGTLLGSRPIPRNVTSEFYGRYCRVQIVTPSMSENVNEEHGYWADQAKNPSLIHWGMCFPHSCEHDDVENLLTKGTLATSGLYVQNAICFERNLDLESDAGAIVAICILSITCAIVLACTIVESAIYYGCLPLPEGWKSLNSEISHTTSPPVSTNSNGTIHEDDDYDMKKDYDVRNGYIDYSGSIKENGVDRASVPNYKTPLKTDKRTLDVLTDPGNHFGQQPQTKSIKSLSIAMTFLETFSMRSNWIKIMRTSNSSDSEMLLSIQGIRVVSIVWIILGHTYNVGGGMDVRNLLFTSLSEIRRIESRLSFTFVLGAFFAVDSFFLISGLLVMMTTLRLLREGKGQSVGFWIYFVLHRFWRLTPIYMMVIMTGTTLYDYVIDGPLKSKPYMMFENCKHKWWKNLLYINNLHKPLETCMPWSWYLATDMQLFLLAPPFIVLVHKKYRFGIIALLSAIIIGVVITFFTTLEYPGSMTTLYVEMLDYVKYVYFKPWSRLAGFAIGMLLGVVLEDMKDKLQFTKLKGFFIWLVLLVVGIFILMIMNDQLKDEGDLWPKGVLALYEALSRPLWCIMVAWIIFACQTGQGGIVADILTSNVFQPLARLTYSLYLVHPMVITFFIYQGTSTVDTGDTNMIYRFCGNVVISYLVAIFFTLMFESPLLGIEKLLKKKK